MSIATELRQAAQDSKHGDLLVRAAKENEELTRALKYCASVLSGDRMSKQELIHALELARSALSAQKGRPNPELLPS